ncbi:Transmembrane and coiled-coil domain-containing protein 4 [Coemansia sp. Benny D160-2]|nr:Transmembrane and coiled-coil domain-containing protein 4 [Coemansia sp. Benny D160-2]
MEALVLKDSIARNWLAALCICSGRCVLATSNAGGDRESSWGGQFTRSMLEWLEVPEADWQDLMDLPFGDAANDMVLLTLRCKRNDEELFEQQRTMQSKSLESVSDPDKLYSGLIFACLGITTKQLAKIGDSAGDPVSSQSSAHGTDDTALLRPFEYDSRSRAAAFVISNWLEMPRQFVCTYEAQIASGLEEAADKARLSNASTSALERDSKRKWGWRKYLAAGAGVAVAGTLVGLTAGLAAPLMAAGMGAIGIGGFGFLATAGGAAMIGSLFGMAGGGLVGKRFNTRLRGIKELYFTQLPLVSESALRPHSLHATVLVPGFLDPVASQSPFMPVRDIMGLDLGDAYTMYFETKELAALQGALSEFVGSTAKSMALSLVLKQTVLSGLIGAFTWPLALLNLAKLIDAPWSVGLERAKRAGKLLADILESRAHGKRPVTLVGYSLGALTIFTCLQQLHRRKAFGIVESAVLLGIPADSTAKEAWSACCRAVSRQVIVGYSQNDWVLAFLFRASSLCSNLAGLSGVDEAVLFKDQPLMRRKLVNLDLASIVVQHADYLDKIDDITLEVSRVL